jgi:dienelactone hydrolase
MLERCFMRTLTAFLLIAFNNPALFAQSQSTRDDFLKLIDRPRTSLAPTIRQLPEGRGLSAIHFAFTTEGPDRVPGLLLKKTGSEGRRPTVIALHGTGDSKEGMATVLVRLAELGFVAVAMDGRYHGERAIGGDYADAIYQAYVSGEEHPFFYDTVWDVTRLIDYLVTREDVDPARIGLIGFSKGGIETYLASAIDPRIAVAVPCIGVQSFLWALENNAWRDRIGTIYPAVELAAEDEGVKVDSTFVRKFYDRVVPGIYSKFDGPAMLPLIAPRPLMVINGDSDSLTPRAGVLEAAELASAAYAKAGVSERFSLRLQENTGHEVRPAALQAALDWFVKWLRP